MILTLDSRRRPQAPVALCRQMWLALGLLASLLLVSCGGGTSQVAAFKPTRMIVLGDEHSLVVDDGVHNGKKYSVNGLSATPARDCLLLPLWTQSVAAHYGFVFAECNAAAAVPQAFMRARLGAKVDDALDGIDAQIAAQAKADSAIGSGDLVTVMMGANDVIDLADRVQAGTLGADAAVIEARARGGRLAERINALLAAGARAVVSSMPDMGLSPYALAQNATTPGAAARISTLSYEFNAYLRTGIDSTRFDGRNYGLVLADDIVQAMARFPTSYALNDVVSAVCVVALPECTNTAADLVPTADGGTAATASNHLWADDRRLAAQAHSYIGSQAVSRVQNNPF